jgi:hypothetical protein
MANVARNVMQTNVSKHEKNVPMSDVTAMHSEETMKYLDKQLVVKVHRDTRVGLTEEYDGSIVHRGGQSVRVPFYVREKDATTHLPVLYSMPSSDS